MNLGDGSQLRKVMVALLRPGEEVIDHDDQGWTSLSALAEALSLQLERPVSADEIDRAARRGPGPRFDLDRDGDRIRPALRARPKKVVGPDILYHATTADQIDRFHTQGVLSAGKGKRVFLSPSESQAWRVAHRFNRPPEVLFIDAGRARRAGIRFQRSRSGLYLADPIPLRHVLNLRSGFRQQFSAGGILLRERDGKNELALVRCSRRSGSTWEIAKGKLEPGEAPEVAAVREVREEMGFTADVSILQSLGLVRYGFQTPEGEPRLKSMYVYLMKADPEPEEFFPAESEGICDVRWFSVQEACRQVTHPSLIQIVHQLRHLLS